MKTFASLFSGSGGADIGAKNAGFEPIWGIEIEPTIADVYAANLGHRPIVESIGNVNPYNLERPDVLWASPPCQQWSNARSKSLPQRADADIGLAIIPFLRVLQPQVFVLENVVGYKSAYAFKTIINTLFELGYSVSWSIINAADFGVPQTRKRLILRAIKGSFVPPLPTTTILKSLLSWQLSAKWMSWYSAIAHLIPTLPETNFALWQYKFIKELTTTTLVQRVGTRGQPMMRNSCQPAWTIRALGHDRHWRQMDALIAPGQVVMITPVALACLQSFPDDYQLPHCKVLATHIIGNAVPPLLAQKLLEAM